MRNYYAYIFWQAVQCVWIYIEFDTYIFLQAKTAPQKYPRYYTPNIGKLPEIYCYNCDKKGHLGRDCTNKKVYLKKK